MRAGRAGVIALGMNRHKNKESVGLFADAQAQIDEYKRNTDFSERKYISFYQIPVIPWLLGLTQIGVGIYLLCLTTGSINSNIEQFQTGLWWHYILVIFLIISGISFLYACKLETIYLDKIKDLVEVNRTNFFCKSKIESRKLSHIQNVTIIKRGQTNLENKTLHYKLVLQFLEGNNLELLETNSSMKIKKRCIKINSFLQRHVQEELHIVDQSRAIDQSRINYNRV